MIDTPVIYSTPRAHPRTLDKEHAGSSQSHGAHDVTLTALTTLGTSRNIAGIWARGDGRAALCQSHYSARESMQCNACTEVMAHLMVQKHRGCLRTPPGTKTAGRILQGRRERTSIITGGGRRLTNEVRMVPSQLAVQFLRVRLVDGGPEAAAPRDHGVDVLGGRHPGVTAGPGGRVAPQHSFHTDRTLLSVQKRSFHSFRWRL